MHWLKSVWGGVGVCVVCMWRGVGREKENRHNKESSETQVLPSPFKR